ncbi:FAD-dependent monooxygenase [Actinoplanes sp. NPDC051411]|uniref:FAD-dependent monooxygenase n=1 Tax=Actinoplanes sp. NPDC051411 TaxID=3155522 RepID=UPI003427A670
MTARPVSVSAPTACSTAGDAAHIHYPAGGQGLNTGVQDVVNLGWKLEDGDGLLDSYEGERRPVASRVLDNTRAQTALTRVDPQTAALRGVFESLIALPDANRSLAEMVSALDVRYPLGEGAGHRAPDRGRPLLLLCGQPRHQMCS